MADSKNITLKVDMDTNDVKSALGTLEKSIDKAFKSSDTKVQSMGNSLNKVTQSIEKTIGRMNELRNTHIETDEFKSLTRDVANLEQQYIKAKKQLDNFKNTKVPTNDYNVLQERMSFLNSEIKNTEKALKGFEQTEVFNAVSKEVSKLERDLGNAEAQLHKFQSAGTNSGVEYNRAANEVNKLSFQLQDARARQQELINSGRQFKNQSSYNDHITMLNIYKQSLEQAEVELKDLIATGQAYRNSDEYNAKIQEVQTLKEQYNALSSALQQMKANGTATITVAEANPEQMDALQDKLTNSYNRAVMLSNAINKANVPTKNLTSNWSNFRNIISKATQAVKGLGRETKTTSDTHSKSFKKMLTTVLKYGFGIRSIFLLYRKLRTAISTGLGEMSKQFDYVAERVYGLRNSFSGFKAGIVSAFEPIFSYIVPALVTLIGYLTTAMNALANFFALLTGRSFYYRAKKGNESVAGAIGGTGAAAKEANKELAEYDDLLVIDQDKDSGGGGGGGGAGDSDAWNWEQVDTTANSLVEKLQDMWGVFKQAWQDKGQDVIEAFKYALESIKALIVDIADTFYRVFMEGYGYDWIVSCLGVLEQMLLIIGDIATAFKEAWDKDNNGYNLVASFFTMLTSINDMCIKIGESWRTAWNSGLGESIIEHVLHIITNIQDTIGALADRFKEAWTEADRGTSIMSGILELIDQFGQFIEDLTSSTKEWAEQLDFGPLLDSANELLKKIKTNLQPVYDLLKSIYEETILPLAKDIIEIYGPKVLDGIGKLTDAIGGIASALQVVYDNTGLVGTVLIGIGTVKLASTAISYLSTAIPTLLSTQVTTIAGSIGSVSLGTVLVSAICALVIGWKIGNKIYESATGNEVKEGMIAQIKDIWDGFTVDKVEFNLLDFIEFAVDDADGGWYGDFAKWSGGLGDKLYDIIHKHIPGVIKEIGPAWKEILLGMAKAWADESERVFTPVFELGEYIWEGIKEGFNKAVNWGKTIKQFFDDCVSKIKEFFGISSPAKKMYEYGKYILLGIIEGFTGAFTNIGQAITDLKDKIVANISEKFTNFKDTIKEKIGELDVRNILGLTEDNSVIDMMVNIGSEFTGKLKSIADFESLNEEWGEFKDAYKDKSAKIKTTLSGIWEKVTDIDGTKDKLVNLWEQYQDKKADLKTTLSGKITEIFGIDDLRTRFTNLTDRWKDKKATLSSYIGGAISKITDLDTWKTKFTNMYNNWRGKTATMASKVGGAISRITDLDTWTNKANTLYYYWRSKTADFKTKFDTTKGALDTWTDKMATLYANWRSKSATFSLSFSAAASDLRSWVNTNVISRINSAFSRVPVLKHHKVPYLARGGILTGPTQVIAGEAGTEAIVPLERNLGWLDKMATMISDKLSDTQIPLIAQGNILPVSQAFMNTANAIVDNSNIATLLESILARLDTLETGDSNKEPIMLQLDGRTVAQVVWDENEKRYKQTGIKYAY